MRSHAQARRLLPLLLVVACTAGPDGAPTGAGVAGRLPAAGGAATAGVPLAGTAAGAGAAPVGAGAGTAGPSAPMTGGEQAAGVGGGPTGGASAGSAGRSGVAAGASGATGAGASGAMSNPGGTGGPAAGAGGSSAGEGGTAGAQATPTFHVFLLLGQSNMAGYPAAQAADKVEEPRVRVLGYDDCASTGRRKDEWAVAVPPLHECWNGAIGPGDHFAKTLLEAMPAADTIGLVPCAISGERIETFLKNGGSKYDWILSRARLALDAGGVIEGFLFHQGESNNGDPSWPGKVEHLVTDLRADLGLGDAPFLAGELAYDGGGSRHNPLVNMLPSVVANAHVVSAEGLALDPADTTWRLHFGHDAQVTFGQRYAEKMREALGW